MPSEQFTDAIALLKADHRTVEGLFAKFEKADSSAKQMIAEEICNDLKIHASIEEEVFYPALRGNIDDDLLDEAYVEHDGAKMLINDILDGGDSDDFYDAKVKVLSEDIEHHVKEEEAPGEGMFAQARKAEVDLVALRDKMMELKQRLIAQLENEGTLPPAQPTTITT